MPQPWQPPPMRSITTASCTSISSTRPPWRATIGFTCSSKTFATRSYSASSVTADPSPEAGFGAAVTAGASAVNMDRMALPTGFPTACHGSGDCFTTVMMFPDTMSSLTARPGIAKIASASGDPFASSAPVNRRTPPAHTGTLTTNLQRWLSIGSAVMRISAAAIPHLSRGGHHVLECRQRLVPAAGLEPAVGVDPDLRAIQHARHAFQRAGDFRHGRHAWRVNVVDARTDLVGILVVLEPLEQLRAGAGALDRDHIRVHALDDPQDVIELAVAHVGVNLGPVPHSRRRQPERVHRPLLVGRPIGPAQGQAFAQRRFVDLDHADARGFEIDDLVADRQRDLLGGFRARLVVAHKGPLQDRHWAGEHAFHRALRERLRVPAPAHGHRARARDVAKDDRRLHIAGTVRLHPAMLGEGESGELLAEVLDHVVALELAVHEHVEPDLFLQRDRFPDLRLDEAIVVRGAELIVVQLPPRRAHFRRLRERSNRRGRKRRQVDLCFPARGIPRTAHTVLLSDGAGAALHGGVVDPRRGPARFGGPGTALDRLAVTLRQRDDLLQFLL